MNETTRENISNIYVSILLLIEKHVTRMTMSCPD